MLLIPGRRLGATAPLGPSKCDEPDLDGVCIRQDNLVLKGFCAKHRPGREESAILAAYAAAASAMAHVVCAAWLFGPDAELGRMAAGSKST